MSTTDSPRAGTNPHEVRRKNFAVRFRGVDPGEVRSFLTGLADELEGIQSQVAVLMQENQALRVQLEESRAELGEARADPMEHATDQAVSVLNQAQQLADSLSDEAMQSARALLRDIMEQAKVAAKGAVNRATAIAERNGSQDASGRDVEYIRMFAKVAQVQFQAVLDALNEQVTRLGEVPGATEPLRSDAAQSLRSNTAQPLRSD